MTLLICWVKLCLPSLKRDTKNRNSQPKLSWHLWLNCIPSHYVPSCGQLLTEYSTLDYFLLPKLKFWTRVTFLACVKNTQKLHTFNTIIMCTQKIMRTQQLLNFFALRIAKSRGVIKSWGSKDRTSGGPQTCPNKSWQQKVCQKKIVAIECDCQYI